jgi:hypothetical protein
MKRWALGTGIAVAALLAGACMSSGVVQLSPDTYRLSRQDGGARYADAAAMKAAVISEADAFAKRQGKVAVPVATHEETMRVGHLSTIDYDFRLASPGDPAPASAAPVQPPPVAAAPKESKPATVEPKSAAQANPDLYTELIKLDDLRKRGILTEEEFQALKAKLLAGK